MAMLAACHAPQIDSHADAMAHAIFDELRHSDNAALAAHLAPELKTPDNLARLATVRSFIPKQEPRRSWIATWNWLTIYGRGTTTFISDEYDYGDRIGLFQVQLYQPEGRQDWVVQGLHFQIATPKELAVNDFTMTGKTPSEYAFLAFVIASPLLMLSALIKVIRTKGLKRKWLWGILAFFGLFLFRMNWTSGEIGGDLLTIQFLGAGATRISAFEPWFLTATLPIGAMLILAGVWANPARARVRPSAGRDKPLVL
jgi:hypothetical protein